MRRSLPALFWQVATEALLIMLRDKNLVPLSRQHQHALALCVRIDRASPIRDSDLAAWQMEMAQLFQSEVAVHFAAEEQVLFPLARGFAELSGLVSELVADHAALRQVFTRAEVGALASTDLTDFAARLSTHIRKEERQLFERLQELLSTEEMVLAGKQLDEVLRDAAQVCAVPTDATSLGPAK
jgi:hemerythrin-like domain-containing protein